MSIKEEEFLEEVEAKAEEGFKNSHAIPKTWEEKRPYLIGYKEGYIEAHKELSAQLEILRKKYEVRKINQFIPCYKCDYPNECDYSVSGKSVFCKISGCETPDESVPNRIS